MKSKSLTVATNHSRALVKDVVEVTYIYRHQMLSHNFARAKLHSCLHICYQLKLLWNIATSSLVSTITTTTLYQQWQLPQRTAVLLHTNLVTRIATYVRKYQNKAKQANERVRYHCFAVHKDAYSLSLFKVYILCQQLCQLIENKQEEETSQNFPKSCNICPHWNQPRPAQVT